MLTGLAAEVHGHALRVLNERECRSELAATGAPMLDLPAVADGVQLGEVYELAELLLEQGVG